MAAVHVKIFELYPALIKEIIITYSHKLYYFIYFTNKYTNNDTFLNRRLNRIKTRGLITTYVMATHIIICIPNNGIVLQINNIVTSLNLNNIRAIDMFV